MFFKRVGFCFHFPELLELLELFGGFDHLESLIGVVDSSLDSNSD